MSCGEGNLRERVAELESLLDSSHQTIHAMKGKLVEMESFARDMFVIADRYLIKSDFSEYARIADEYCPLCRADNGGKSPCASTAEDLEESHCNPYMLDYLERRMAALGLLERSE